MENVARFVLNSQYWHVARNGEVPSKYAKTSNYVKNLVEYIGTRETVSLNFLPEVGNTPATKRQQELIKEYIRSVNMSDKKLNEILEYNDYLNNPTKQNASELIAYLQEQILLKGTFDEAANLVEYMAQRPSAVKVGEHGLFSAEDNIDLKKAMKEVSEYEGNIWTHVLSLRREDADRLGYDSQKPWKDLVKSKIDVIAKSHNINVQNLKWYGAMHNTGHHPHIHLIVFADENSSKKPYLKKDDIKTMKTAFANEIFKYDNHNEYVAKHEYRKELKQKSEKLLSELLNNPQEYYSNENINNLVNKINNLAIQLPDSGRIVYGYMPKEIKSLVNEIQRELVYNNPILSQLYMGWCNHQFNIERNYVTTPKQAPVEHNPEFTPIKNMILKQAKIIKENSIIYPIHNTAEELDTHTEFTSDNTYKENSPLSEANTEYNNVTIVADESNAIQPQIKHGYELYAEKYPGIKELVNNDDTSDLKNFKALNFLANDFSTRTGDMCRELGNCYNYGNGVERNVAEASMWYGIASDTYGDNMAAYRLGQIYLYGAKDIEIDKDLGHYYCKKAFYGLKNEIKNSSFFTSLEEGNSNLEYIDKVPKSDAYKEYLMARMFLKGEGVVQDYDNAYKAFLLSAEHGNTHSYYYLGNIHYYELGVEQNYSTAFNCYQQASNANDSYAAYRLAKMYKYGEGTEVDLKQAENYYKKSCDKVAMANYDIARLYEKYQKTFSISDEEINNHYRIALEKLIKQDNELHDSYTQMRIASMYLDGKGTDVNVDEAVKWLEKATKLDCPDAFYQLGYIYSNDKYVLKDEVKAFENYQKAIQYYTEAEKENTNSTVQFRLGKMYHHGLGTEKNITEAIKWYSLSAEQNNAEASYQLFKIFSKGIDVPVNSEKAEYYLKIAASGNNQYALITLAKLELERGNTSAGLDLLQKLSPSNNADILYQLGNVYSLEKFRINDTEKSTSFYQKALELYLDRFQNKPDGDTAYRIGNMYFYGLGTEIKIDEAIKWYRMSAEFGNKKAQEKLAEAQKQQELSALSILSTACHFGRMINTETQASAKQRYASDSKILRNEKINKIMAGHAVDDYSTSDYNY